MATEIKRQAEIIVTALSATVRECSAQFETPTVNALASAIITLEAAMINSVPDRKVRKELIRVMKIERRKALNSVNGRGTVKILTDGIGKPLH